jgi:hypothetical protein
MSSGWRLVFMAPAGNMEAEADRTPVLTLPEISSIEIESTSTYPFINHIGEYIESQNCEVI